MTAPGAALRDPGVRSALASAALFGAAAPLAALLLRDTGPWMLAALLYLGAGLGLVAYRRITRAPAVRVPRRDVPWLVAAIASGGVAAPVLLMAGLTSMPASSASLLLTAEGAFTAVLAWVVFQENVDRRVAAGFGSILAGVVLLAWPGGGVDGASLWPALAVLAACLLWALDNNLTRRVSLNDATWLATVKGCAAGSVNLALALLLGARLPAAGVTLAAGGLGLVSYGVSLVLFVLALRSLGTARTGAYFSVAPFVGACIAVALGDPVTWRLVVAGVLMALGIWLHLTERHEHRHIHQAVMHSHALVADAHHDGIQAPGPHAHPAAEHSHPHYPDAHHRHPHTAGPDPEPGAEPGADVRPPA
jgi:drug/metabolite transporter (DMT)-like permease